MSEHYFTPELLARFSAEKMKKINLHSSAHLFCDLYCLQPGQAQKDHAHDDSDKVYCVLNGRPTIRIGDEYRELGADDVAIAPAGVIHGVRNETEENAVLLVIMAPPPSGH
ncbi:MAG: cupin domain-containing protein [Proteobacteria bacterium]|nr:MAG: cupin domain-containing protein [Pseudomonadota bacterium]